MYVNKHCVFYCSKFKTIHGGTPVQTIIYIYLRFIITLVKGMFDLQIDKKKNKKKLSSMNKSCEKKTTAHSQNILHVNVLYNIEDNFFLFFFLSICKSNIPLTSVIMNLK
jgi:hypothetical protein